MVDKASTISLKEIRDYLMETDALENAESILLHNRIDRLNKKVVKTAGDSDEKKFSVDAVKISQLLGDIDPHDNRNKEKERYDSNSVGNSEELVGQREARTTAGLTKQKYDEFMEFERIAQQEVLELERKKELMMSKLYDNRQKIEVYRLVNEPNRDSQRKNDNGADDADKIGNGHSVGGPLTKDSVHQLVELSQNHARKMAESKARAEALERELQQLRQGKTSVDLDLIRSLTKRPAGKNPVESLSCDRNNSERAANGLPDALTRAIGGDSAASTEIVSCVTTEERVSTAEARKSRVKAITASLASEEQILQQQQMLEVLKNQAEEDMKLISSIRNNAINNIIGSKSDSLRPGVDRAQFDATHSADVDEKDRLAASVPRSVKEYLDEWLLKDKQPLDIKSIRRVSHGTVASMLTNTSPAREETSRDDMTSTSTARKSPILPGRVKNSESTDQPIAHRSEKKTNTPEKSRKLSVDVFQEDGADNHSMNAPTSKNYLLQRDRYEPQDFQKLRRNLQYNPTNSDQSRYSINNRLHPGRGQPAYNGFPGYNPMPNNQYGPVDRYGIPSFMPTPIDPLQQLGRLEHENYLLANQAQGQPDGNGAAFNNNNYLLNRGVEKRAADRDDHFHLERDKLSKDPLVRAEMLHQQEIKRLQYELEKLQYQKELEEFKAEIDNQREQRIKESQHQQWLDEQKKLLEAIKIQQLVAKEERLLKLQSLNDQVIGNSAESGDSMLQLLKEECGVGTVSIPVDLCSGVSVLVDGLLIKDKGFVGFMFRVALGLFDGDGKSLVRLTASTWQSWPNSQTVPVTVLLDKAINRALTAKELVDASPPKCLIEVQVREDEGSSQSSLGWCVVALTQNSNLSNAAWKCALRKGISDPTCDPQKSIPVDEQTQTLALVRIVDSNELHKATAWTLGASGVVNTDHFNNLYRSTSEDLESFASKRNETQDQQPVKTISSPAAAAVPLRRLQSQSSIAAGNFGLDNQRASSSDIETSVRRQKSVRPSSMEPSSAQFPPSSMRPLSSRSSAAPTPAKGFAMKSFSPKAVAMGALNEDDDKDDAPSAVVHDEKHYWYLGTPLGPCLERYQRGDGIDIYVDGAMFLPDNCTITRVNLRLFTSEKQQVCSTFEGHALSSSVATSPIFKLKAECRAKVFNATTIVLIRIDTIDCNTLLPAGAAYASFKLFATRDRSPVQQANDPNAYINTGAFQLPLHGGRLSNDATFNENILSVLPKIPCSSLLVRVYPAPKSADGISTLSRDEFQKEEWLKLGLDIPAPPYYSGAYSGALCEPTPSEIISFNVKSRNIPDSVESAIVQAMSVGKTHSLPARPTNSDKTEEWLTSLLPSFDQMRRSLDYSLAIPYSAEAGLLAEVISLYNMPDNTVFTNNNYLYKVVVSMSPPGLFYRDPPLYDNVYYTADHKLNSSFRMPEYLANNYEFNPAMMESNLYLIFDVRLIHFDTKSNNKDVNSMTITVEPPIGRKCYWTLLPLSREKINGQGYRYVQSGIFQLPLIEGPVPAEELLRSDNPYMELSERLASKNKSNYGLKVADGASILVKIYNPLLKQLQSSSLDTTKGLAEKLETVYLENLLSAASAGLTGVNGSKMEKFVYDSTKLKNSKTIEQLLPKGKEPAEIMRIVNKVFEEKIGLSA